MKSKSKISVIIAIIALIVILLSHFLTHNKATTHRYSAIGTINLIGFEQYRDINYCNASLALLDTPTSQEYSYIKCDMKYQQSNSYTHADEIIEIIHDLCPGLTIDLYIVADNDGIVNNEWLLSSLISIDEKKSQYTVVNMSFSTTYDQDIADVIKRIDDKGTLFVASAGNYGYNSSTFPASLNSVVSIGGVAETGFLHSMSNYGGIDYVMPIKYSSMLRNTNYIGTSVSSALFSVVVVDVSAHSELTEKNSILATINRLSINPNNDPLLGRGQPILTKMLKEDVL